MIDEGGWIQNAKVDEAMVYRVEFQTPVHFLRCTRGVGFVFLELSLNI